MREIVLDTETTGLDPAAGHRVVEIGAVELINHIPTGRTYWSYLNPERDMPEEAFRVHGLSTEFLSDKPLFADIANGFLDFIGEAVLVIHNAAFDLKFLNAELARCKRSGLETHEVIDTVALARQRFPGSPANLDALCRRFGIDNSARTEHGALLDARLLCDVYLEFLGGREPSLVLGADRPAVDNGAPAPAGAAPRPARPHAASAEEIAAHRAFLARLTDPIWARYDLPELDLLSGSSSAASG